MTVAKRQRDSSFLVYCAMCNTSAVSVEKNIGSQPNISRILLTMFRFMASR